MSAQVSAHRIEQIVGAKRHDTDHLARAVSSEQRVYILHSKSCKNAFPDLRDCQYSVALDLGIDTGAWDGYQDTTVVVGIDPEHDDLVPIIQYTPAEES